MRTFSNKSDATRFATFRSGFVEGLGIHKDRSNSCKCRLSPNCITFRRRRIKIHHRGSARLRPSFVRSPFFTPKPPRRQRSASPLQHHDLHYRQPKVDYNCCLFDTFNSSSIAILWIAAFPVDSNVRDSKSGNDDFFLSAACSRASCLVVNQHLIRGFGS